MNYRSFLRWLPWVVTLLLFLGFALDRVMAWPDHGPDESLLASSSIFPVTWGTDQQRSDVMEWHENQYGPWVQSEIVDPTFHQSWTGGLWYTAQSWHAANQANGPTIRQDLKAYGRSPLRAALKLRQVDTGDVRTWEAIPFSAPITKQAVTLDATTTSALAATEYRALCAVGLVERCEMWYAWLRYGQYLLQINVTTPQYGMDLQTFSAFVRDTDIHISRQLAHTR